MIVTSERSERHSVEARKMVWGELRVVCAYCAQVNPVKVDIASVGPTYYFVFCAVCTKGTRCEVHVRT